MEIFVFQLLNVFFYVFHTSLIVFNMLGWIFPKTRRLNLYCLLLTFFSWGVLGLWRGLGYCFLTDWHYQVLRKLGESELPNSYISFLIERLSGWQPDAQVVYYTTLFGALAALGTSFWVNFKRFIIR